MRWLFSVSNAVNTLATSSSVSLVLYASLEMRENASRSKNPAHAPKVKIVSLDNLFFSMFFGKKNLFQKDQTF